jgi:predicted DNA-binding protein
MPGPTRQIALRLPHEMVEWLELRAKQDDRSFAYVVKKIVEAEMQRERKKAARAK